MKKAVFNWSGGKDSAYCLFKLLKGHEYNIEYLLTTVSEKHNRISMHGVREELLDAQSLSIGIPVKKLFLPENADIVAYENIFLDALQRLKDEGITDSVFGDIFLEDLREYREKQLVRMDITAVFPLWKMDTKKLAHDFINAGFKAIVVCVDERFLDQSFAGREFDLSFLSDLPDNVDFCGENGEFHSFVYDGPIFKDPVKINIGDIVYRKYKSDADPEFTTGFYYCDLLPAV
jgi:uncharacterized protein (TIGR00290 family)